MTSGKLWPVSTCMSGNGKRAGRKAFSARRSSTIESLPPLKSRTGRSSSAATSRMTWMASASRIWRSAARRCVRTVASITCSPHSRLVGARPAALAAVAGLGAGRAADRRVALVVQRVVGQVALVDAPPEVALGPVGERVVLPHRALLVALDELRVGARGGLLAADAGDPRVGARQRALERGDLARRRSSVGVARPRQVAGFGGVLDVDVHAEAVLEGAPGLQRLGEEHAGVDGHDARVRRERQQLVEEDRLLLLEGAQEDELLVLGGLGQGVGQTAHSPSPLWTTKGSLRSQSMKCSIVSRPNSTGRARSRTSSSKVAVPTRSAKALNSSPSVRSAS